MNNYAGDYSDLLHVHKNIACFKWFTVFCRKLLITTEENHDWPFIQGVTAISYVRTTPIDYRRQGQGLTSLNCWRHKTQQADNLASTVTTAPTVQ